MGIIDAIRRLAGGAARATPKAELTSMTLDELLRTMINGNGGMTASGAMVTPTRAMRVVAVYACVRVLAETLAQVPLIVYRRNGDSKERATDHWLYRLLHDSPNEFQSSFEWREMMQGHVALRGNAYSYKVRVRDQIRELLPLHPDKVQVRQNDDWSLTYSIALPDGSRAEAPAADILHIRGLSINGFMGLSPVGQAREAVGLAIETERHGAQLFGNGARPGGLLTTEQRLDADQIKQTTESWASATSGENRLKTPVLDGGLQYQAMGLSSEDAQFLDTRKFQRNEIASLFRIPPHMVGDLDRATFSNIEHQALEFVKYTMGPWFARWEQAILKQLVPMRDQAGIFAEFLVDGLLRGDVKSRTQAYSLGLRDGYLNRNEVRAMENRNPIEGGDEYRMAENVYGPADQGGIDRREQKTEQD